MKIRTELLEYLIRQCVVEVLDQMQEDANASKLKSSGIGKGDDVKPIKQKVTSNPFRKGGTLGTNVKKLDESENPELGGDTSPPQDGQGAGDQPAAPKDEPKPEEPKPEEPKPQEPPQRIPKGAVILSPKDKSNLQPIKWIGRDESSIERTLHQVAVSIAGPRTKVSLGAKRLAREAVANPKSTVFFFLGKTDPESEEVFLMADKSLQVAKNDSVQSGELANTSVSPLNQTVNYSAPKDYDDEYIARMGSMTDTQYSKYMDNRYQANPQGIDEGATKLIKKMVRQILDS